MLILVLTLMTARTQDIAGPITDCPVIVEVVDVAWDVMPGVDVTVRDERTQRKERLAPLEARAHGKKA